MEQYFWDIMPSRKSTIETIKLQKKAAKEKASFRGHEQIPHTHTHTLVLCLKPTCDEDMLHRNCHMRCDVEALPFLLL